MSLVHGRISFVPLNMSANGLTGLQRSFPSCEGMWLSGRASASHAEGPGSIPGISKTYCAAGVVVSCKIPILATRVRFPAAHTFSLLTLKILGRNRRERYQIIACKVTFIFLHYMWKTHRGQPELNR